MNPWEEMPKVTMCVDDLGGTVRPYEQFGDVETKEKWITWNLGWNGAYCSLYGGGEDCELEVTLGLGYLDSLRMFYDETGELEKINMSLVHFLFLTGEESLMEMAGVMAEHGQDALVGIYVFSGRVVIDWDHGDGRLGFEMDESVGDGEEVCWFMEMFSGGELEVTIGMGVDQIEISINNWRMEVSRRVDAGAIEDIKSPGVANDFLFGELITIDELPPGDGGFAGELDLNEF